MSARRSIVLIVMLLLGQGCSSWSTRDYVMQGAVFTTLAADAALTIHGQSMGAVESNPMLGSHPSAAGVIGYTASAAVIHLAISALIQDRGWRTFFQGTTVAAESWCAFSNAYLLANAPRGR